MATKSPNVDILPLLVNYLQDVLNGMINPEHWADYIQGWCIFLSQVPYISLYLTQTINGKLAHCFQNVSPTTNFDIDLKLKNISMSLANIQRYILKKMYINSIINK